MDEFDELWWIQGHSPDEWRFIARTLLETPPEQRPLTMHPPGEPCAVLGLLFSNLPERIAMDALWNETCFPMDDWAALEQAVVIVEDARGGARG